MNRLDRLTAILVQLQSKKIVKAEELVEELQDQYLKFSSIK